MFTSREREGCLTMNCNEILSTVALEGLVDIGLIPLAKYHVSIRRVPVTVKNLSLPTKTLLNLPVLHSNKGSCPATYPKK